MSGQENKRAKADVAKTFRSTNLPKYKRSLQLEQKSDTTANIAFSDFDGDGHLDILLVKGRHWPIVDRILFGDGRGNVRKSQNVSDVADRSYTGGLADFNGDGFMDIAVSNDAPDKKLIYVNDGKGNFNIASEFGIHEWPTRNILIADINSDGSQDIVVANRSESHGNYICLNRGNGRFDTSCIRFAPYPATTIAAADCNDDGFVDLVVPHRDGGQSYVYFGNSDTDLSDNQRTPFGDSNATIRMAALADFNLDHVLDIVTVDERKGVTIFFGERDGRFSDGLQIADPTIVPYAVSIADLNDDGRVDILVGHVEAPSSIFYNDGTGRQFTKISFGDARGTVYGFAIADFDNDGNPDIGTARSDAPNVVYFGGSEPKRRKR